MHHQTYDGDEPHVACSKHTLGEGPCICPATQCDDILDHRGRTTRGDHVLINLIWGHTYGDHMLIRSCYLSTTNCKRHYVQEPTAWVHCRHSFPTAARFYTNLLSAYTQSTSLGSQASWLRACFPCSFPLLPPTLHPSHTPVKDGHSHPNTFSGGVFGVRLNSSLTSFYICVYVAQCEPLPSRLYVLPHWWSSYAL